MQFVPGISSAQTMPAAPAPAGAGRKPSLWILDSWRDLVLYVCTPLLLVPMFIAAQGFWSAEYIYLFVAAFGAMGHHLPGMIRAYGDRALFQRFRWRFICAPIFLVVVCAAFSVWNLTGIVLVAFIWGVWHGMMQTYGFCRIYDAKVGSFAEVTRRLDFAVCGIWFATAVLLSPQRMTDTLETYYSAGGPFIPPAASPGRAAGLACAGASNFSAVSGEFYLDVEQRQAAQSGETGAAASRVFRSGGTAITSWRAFWWAWRCSRYFMMCNTFRSSGFIIGNESRATALSVGSCALCSGAVARWWEVYIGLVLAYGGLSLSKSYVGIDAVKNILTGVVTASALLHFYYDGFIWKVREKSTRQSLGITGGTTDVSLGGFLPGWALHGAKWVAIFVIPLGILWFAEMRSDQGKLERLGSIVADLPTSARARVNFGTELQEAGRADEAAKEFAEAIRLNPGSAKTHVNLGSLLTTKGELDQAESHFEQALRIEPKNAEYHSGYAYLLDQLGRKDQAASECETAIRLAPKSAQAALWLWRVPGKTRTGGRGNREVSTDSAVRFSPRRRPHRSGQFAVGRRRADGSARAF